MSRTTQPPTFHDGTVPLWTKRSLETVRNQSFFFLLFLSYDTKNIYLVVLCSPTPYPLSHFPPLLHPHARCDVHRHQLVDEELESVRKLLIDDARALVATAAALGSLVAIYGRRIPRFT